MKNAQVKSFIEKIKDKLVEPDFVIDEFHFTLSDPVWFNPYTIEACKIAGFYEEEAPSPKGFFYCTNDYKNYLKTLKENSQKHPANFDNLNWYL